MAGGESTAAWALDQERSPRGADPCITGVQEAWRQASRVQQVAVTGSGRPDCSLPHHRIEMAGSDASSDGFDRSPLHGESGGGGEGEEAPAPAPHAEGGGDTGGGEWASAEGSAQVPQAGVEAGAEGAEQKEAPAPAGAATAGSAGGADAKVFIGGLTGDTTEMHLRDHFQPYGDITDAVVMRDKMTQKSRGFGFVTFASADSVERVLADKVCWSLYGVSRYVCAIACARAFLRVCVHMHMCPDARTRPLTQGKHDIAGRNVDVKSAVPRDAMPAPPRRDGPAPAEEVGPVKKIFVGGLDGATRDEDLKEYFAKYGPVAEASVMMDQATQRSRNFGFVTFESTDSVAAVMKDQAAQHVINDKKVDIKRALPKGAQTGRDDRGGVRGGRGGPMRGGPGDRGGGYGGFDRGFGDRGFGDRGGGYGGYDRGGGGGYRGGGGGGGGGYGQLQQSKVGWLD